MWIGLRQGRAVVHTSQPFSAFTVPVTIANPGPDGVAGSADDGTALQGYALDAAHLSLSPVQVIQNLDSRDSDHYTWEITANKRGGRVSILGSFTETWSKEGFTVLTPNDLINTTDGRNNTSRWNAKAQGTREGPWGIRMVGFWRHQAGINFSPTFTTRLNYASVAIKASPSDQNRLAVINIVDLRAERYFRFNTKGLGASRVGLFFDVYNLFNDNGAQDEIISYGVSYLRPVNITGPRIARVGARFTFSTARRAQARPGRSVQRAWAALFRRAE